MVYEPNVSFFNPKLNPKKSMGAKILWADDEIDLLRPHILFLEEKGYEVITVNNGIDAVDAVKANDVDIVFLDENMPGLSGLETLDRIIADFPSLPIIMITKSEEEAIMEEAIGSKISDYLIKPVNPKQILLSVKKNLDEKRLRSEKATTNYQQEFRQIGMRLNDPLEIEDWKELYRKIIRWDLELAEGDQGMDEVLQMQKKEANRAFAKFISSNYIDWVQATGDAAPLMSHNVFKRSVIPELGDDPLFVIVIDNLRFDQYLTLKPLITQFFRLEEESMYMSILPTATQYARNAMFAGMMPADIQKQHPKLWLNDDEEGGKNQHEQELLAAQLKGLGVNVKHSYHKITNLNAGKKLVENFSNLGVNDLNVIVYNFVDMLSHARTDMEVIRELADDEAAYRSLTKSWFEHSALYEIIRQIADMNGRLMVTTDHGTMHVKNPVKVVGDRNTSTNLRYKQGRNLSYNANEVFEVQNPAEAKLPQINVSSRYVFCEEDDFFVYPNNQNYYVNYYRDTFQHGGVSLEEILIPLATFRKR